MLTATSIVMALAVWDLYVGIGRVFAPSIHRDDGAPFGRPVASEFEVVNAVCDVMCAKLSHFPRLTFQLVCS